MNILIYGVSEKEIHIFSRLVLLPQVKTFGDFPWTKREELSFSLHNNMTAWGEGKKSKAPIARQEMLQFSLFFCDFMMFVQIKEARIHSSNGCFSQPWSY